MMFSVNSSKQSRRRSRYNTYNKSLPIVVYGGSCFEIMIDLVLESVFLSYFGIFILIFAVIWIVQFIIGKKNIKRMNEKLSETRNTDSNN